MYITFGSDTSYSNLQRSSTRSLQERSLDIGRALKSVNLIQSSWSLDCKANVEQFNHQCFERSVKIYEPLEIEVKKPRIYGRHIMRDNVEAECPEDYLRKSITVPLLEYALNEMKWMVYRPTRQNRFGMTVGSIYYWKYCSITEPPPVNRVSGTAPDYPHFSNHEVTLKTHHVGQPYINITPKVKLWLLFFK